MSKIKIELEVTPIQLVQIANLLKGGAFEKLTQDKPEPAKTEKPKKAGKPKKQQKAPEPEPEEEPEADVQDPGQQEDAPGATLNDIRSIMADKVKNHREAVKNQLSTYDAKNVSSLDEKHYGDFYKFLTDLK